MPSDFELLDGWRRGDRVAGNKLFDRYFDTVARFFRNKAREGVDDLVQATFLGCVEGKDRFRGEGDFRAFLFGIAHNVLRRHIRTKVRHGDKIDFGVTSMHDVGPGPSTIVARRAAHQQLLAALRQIPVDFQVALELYYWEQMRAPRIAEILEVPEGTVRTRIRRGKEILAQRMVASLPSGGDQEATLAQLDEWANELRQEVLGGTARG